MKLAVSQSGQILLVTPPPVVNVTKKTHLRVQLKKFRGQHLIFTRPHEFSDQEIYDGINVLSLKLPVLVNRPLIMTHNSALSAPIDFENPCIICSLLSGGRLKM